MMVAGHSAQMACDMISHCRSLRD